MSARRRLSICYAVPGHSLVASAGPTRNVLSLARALSRWADVTVAFQRLADTEALEQAVQTVRRGYIDLVREGHRVLADRDAASLPTRAKEALDRERERAALKAGPTDLIPGSRRVTYATVLAFEGVAQARAAWQKLRETLEKLAGLRKP